jgi:hypothetical protein
MLLETVFHISAVLKATLLSDAINTTTINPAIKPYSTAVAPLWHDIMPRIVSNITFGPISQLVANNAFFPHKR